MEKIEQTGYNEYLGVNNMETYFCAYKRYIRAAENDRRIKKENKSVGTNI